MIEFDQAKADAVVTATDKDGLVRVFCDVRCRADWRNNVYASNALADRNMYGCWQCGEDLLQGLSLDMPMTMTICGAKGGNHESQRPIHRRRSQASAEHHRGSPFYGAWSS